MNFIPGFSLGGSSAGGLFVLTSAAAGASLVTKPIQTVLTSIGAASVGARWARMTARAKGYAQQMGESFEAEPGAKATSGAGAFSSKNIFGKSEYKVRKFNASTIHKTFNYNTHNYAMLARAGQRVAIGAVALFVLKEGVDIYTFRKDAKLIGDLYFPNNSSKRHDRWRVSEAILRSERSGSPHVAKHWEAYREYYKS